MTEKMLNRPFYEVSKDKQDQKCTEGQRDVPKEFANFATRKLDERDYAVFMLAMDVFDVT